MVIALCRKLCHGWQMWQSPMAAEMKIKTTTEKKKRGSIRSTPTSPGFIFPGHLNSNGLLQMAKALFHYLLDDWVDYAECVYVVCIWFLCVSVSVVCGNDSAVECQNEDGRPLMEPLERLNRWDERCCHSNVRFYWFHAASELWQWAGEITWRHVSDG